MRKLGIIIPAFNEEKTIGQVLYNVRTYARFIDTKAFIIIVNDGSTDNTLKKINEEMKASKIFESINVKLVIFNNKKNIGQTQSINKALKHLKEKCNFKNDDIVVLQDADGEFPESFIKKAYEILINDDYKTTLISGIYGSRFINRKPKSSKLIRYLGIKTFTFLINKFFNNYLLLTDAFTGSKAFFYGKLKNLESEKFTLNTEITIKLLQQGEIIEIPICYEYRKYGISKFRLFKDGWQNFKYLLKKIYEK